LDKGHGGHHDEDESIGSSPLWLSLGSLEEGRKMSHHGWMNCEQRLGLALFYLPSTINLRPIVLLKFLLTNMFIASSRGVCGTIKSAPYFFIF
jgi:hypothetical protein